MLRSHFWPNNSKWYSTSYQVDCGVGEECVSQSDSVVCNVEDTDESFKGNYAKSIGPVFLIANGGNVLYNQIYLTGNTSREESVKVLRPYLSVRSEWEVSLIKEGKVVERWVWFQSASERLNTYSGKGETQIMQLIELSTTDSE
jgi:hypothetical protein